MSRKVVLFTVRAMSEENDKAQEIVKSLLGDDFEIVACPPTMIEMFVCPFVTDEWDSPYYGLEGIRYFVESRREKVEEVVGPAR